MAIRRIFGSDSDSCKYPFKKTGFSKDCAFLEFWQIADLDFRNIFKGLFRIKICVKFDFFFVFSK